MGWIVHYLCNVSNTPMVKKNNQVVLHVKAKSRAQPQRKSRSNNGRAITTRSSVPVNISVNRQQGRPRMGIRNGNITASHSEAIAQIYTPSVWANGTFVVPYAIRLNPGLSGAFPWASGLAGRYESYMFHKLNFRLDPAPGTSINGIIMMAVDFDSADAAPSNYQQLMSYEHARENNAWKGISFSCPAYCLHKRKTYFVRTSSSLPDLGELNLSDTGVLYIAMTGITNSTGTVLTNFLLGNLVVDYEVEFNTPVMHGAVTSAALNYYATNNRWDTLISPSSTYQNFKSSEWDSLASVEAPGDQGGDYRVWFKRPGNYYLQTDFGSNNQTCLTTQYAITNGPGVSDAQSVFAVPLAGSGTSADAGVRVTVNDVKGAWVNFKTNISSGAATVVTSALNLGLSYAADSLTGIFGVDYSNIKDLDGNPHPNPSIVKDLVTEGQFLASLKDSEKEKTSPYEASSASHHVPIVGTPTRRSYL